MRFSSVLVIALVSILSVPAAAQQLAPADSRPAALSCHEFTSRIGTGLPFEKGMTFLHTLHLANANNQAKSFDWSLSGPVSGTLFCYPNGEFQDLAIDYDIPTGGQASVADLVDFKRVAVTAICALASASASKCSTAFDLTMDRVSKRLMASIAAGRISSGQVFADLSKEAHLELLRDEHGLMSNIGPDLSERVSSNPLPLDLVWVDGNGHPEPD